ncbi:cytochrome P450 [Amylocystis lapponica]|nr:cytochrome P450 [Amylocystis lapponica]
MTGTALLATFLVLASIAFWLYRSPFSRHPTPPGPKPKFWLGNVHQLSPSQPWLTFAKWSETYGPVVFLRILRKKTVVLNSLQAAFDLLDARSSVYSERPWSWSHSELAGRSLSVFWISSQHPRFRKYRTLLQSGLNPRAVQAYRHIQEEEARVLLQGLAKTPGDFTAHVRRNAGAVILKVAYGWTVSKDDDYFVNLIEDTFKLNTTFHRPGRFLMDSIPVLRFVPSWFPFATFHQEIANYRESTQKIERIPFLWTKEQVESGNYVESFVSQLLRPDDGTVPSAEEEAIIMACGSALYAGGADTVVAAFTTFFLAMTLNPECQKRAQAEIDRVTGGRRLPTFDDQADLPYVSALVKEVLRWSPPVPLGLPHTSTQEDEYNGFWTPKGTTVMANIWFFSRDNTVYPEPEVFRPERFLPSKGSEPQLEPRKFVFGFGRRICPGLHFAEVSLWLVMSNVLAVFNISKAIDAQGQEIEPIVEWTTSITSHPKAFPCRIVCRAPDLLAE